MGSGLGDPDSNRDQVPGIVMIVFYCYWGFLKRKRKLKVNQSKMLDMKKKMLILISIVITNYCLGDSIHPIKKTVPSLYVSAVKDKPSDSTQKEFDWTNNLISAIMGGLIGLSPVIINFFKKTKIKGKMLSQYASIGEVPGSKNVSIIVQKVSIFAANKNFFLKDLDIYVKYPSSQEIQCKNWTFRTYHAVFNENGVDVRKKLNIDPKEYLIHLTVLPKEESVVGYILFSVDSTLDERFEYVRYVFKDYKGVVKKLKFDYSEINDNTQLYDDSIWV